MIILLHTQSPRIAQVAQPRNSQSQISLKRPVQALLLA
jgi:hypothetical protein